MRKLASIIFLALIITSLDVCAEEKGDGGFTDIINIESTPVKSQGSTGTCWSFATTS
ncbi:MAG: aminopeptidase, partial [Mariniphaga sp.]|nr:aminopeptidase [Mariniphaga sp.]